MEVTLCHYTPLQFCSRAIRTCWDSHDKADPDNPQGEIDLIERVGKKYKHESVLEHIVFQFHIKKITRACLQEVARHRMASLSVKSTRYTLRQLLKHWDVDKDKFTRTFDLERFCRPSGKVNLDNHAEKMLAYICRRLIAGDPNDEAKYLLPESFYTNLAWTINLRSLLNFLELRTSENALHEIRLLSQKIILTLPEKLAPFYQPYFKEVE